MLKLARQRKIDSIVVWKLDRWGRSLNDLISSLQELNNLGVAFISLTEGLDLSTALGRAFAGLLSVFAEFERDLISERIKAGLQQAKGYFLPTGLNTQELLSLYIILNPPVQCALILCTSMFEPLLISVSIHFLTVLAEILIFL